MTIYQADWVCPISSPPVRNGAIAVRDGRIVSVGPAEMASGPEERLVYRGCALIPGFVDAHTHIELTLFKGLLEGLSFSEWISRLVRMKYHLCTREDFEASARLGAMEMLQAGITTLGEVMDIGTGWEAMAEFGLRGIAYQEVFGPAADSASESLRSLRDKVHHLRGSETVTRKIGVSPHAPYTVSKPLFESVRDFARAERLRMTSHTAESKAEVSFVRDGEGPFADSHRRRGIPILKHNCSPIAYLDSLGLLGPDMLVVHSIEVDGHDLDRLRETGTFVVHCPKSNAVLGHGVADVAGMWRRGVTVALGTDSDASNDSIDMFAEMREAWSQQHLSFEEAFRMATLNGARALGLDHEVGSLEPGKLADFSVAELKGSLSDPLEDMVRFGSRSDVGATFIGGREIRVESLELQEKLQHIRSRLKREI